MSSVWGSVMSKYVHIDMKGGPPTLTYLVELLEVMAEWGADGVVVEWEDMFPWSGELSVLARPGHFTLDMVSSLLDHAARLHLKVIPLIQTFGHMEFVLKHEKFRHLRQLANVPNCVRPLSLDTETREVRTLLAEMVRQVTAAHPGLSRLHIGCDEVWCLGQSDRARHHMEKLGLTATDLYLDHVSGVCDLARQMVAGLRVLVWDDMMRSASLAQLSRLEVEPVVWSYGQVSLPPGLLARYHQVWPGSVWAASAWRGATGPAVAATTVSRHLENHLSWLGVEAEGEIRGETTSMAGIIMTGWARYDHYAAHCELLPASLPSLAACLAVLKTRAWTEATHREVSVKLGLSEPLMLEPYMFLAGKEAEVPRFPGSSIYSGVMTYIRLASQYQALMNSAELATWLNPWQLKKGFLNPLQVQPTVQELSRLHHSLKLLAVILEKDLTHYLHDFTAEEWINTNISPKIENIESILSKVLPQLS